MWLVFHNNYHEDIDFLHLHVPVIHSLADHDPVDLDPTRERSRTVKYRVPSRFHESPIKISYEMHRRREYE